MSFLFLVHERFEDGKIEREREKETDWAASYESAVLLQNVIANFLASLPSSSFSFEHEIRLEARPGSSFLSLDKT